MKLRVETPAPIAETMQLYTRAGIAKPIEIKSAIFQLYKSESFGFFDGDRLVAAIGFYPLRSTADETTFELWFVCRADIGRLLIPLRKAAHLTLAKVAEGGGVRIRACVRQGHLPGVRLARLMELQHVGRKSGFEIFEWAKGPAHGKSDRGSQSAVQGQRSAGHEGPEGSRPYGAGAAKANPAKPASRR